MSYPFWKHKLQIFVLFSNINIVTVECHCSNSIILSFLCSFSELQMYWNLSHEKIIVIIM